MSKKILMILICLGVYASSTQAELICHWKLDQTSGYKIKDYSGNDYHGSAEGIEWITENGKGIAVECSTKRKSQITVDPEFFSKLDEEISISIWQKIRDWENARSRLCSALDTEKKVTLNIHLPFWADGRIYWDAGINSGGRRNRVRKLFDKVELANWNHWVFTKDSPGNMSIYLNGELWYSKAMPEGISLTGETFFLVSVYSGMLRDISIFDTALSQEEVINLYRMGTGFFTEEPALLQTWERFKKYQVDKDYKKIIDFVEQGRLKLTEKLDRADEVMLTDIYMILGDSYKATGKSEEAKEAYIKSMTHRSLDVSCYAADLYRISQELSLDELRPIIENSLRNSGVLQFEIPDTAHYFEIINEYDLFKLFVDSVFETKGNSIEYAESINESLHSSKFKDFLYNYCKSKPELLGFILDRDKEQINSYVQDGNYEKAFSVCEQLEQKASTKKRKGLLEYECGKILFEGGDYEQAIKELKGFVDKYKSSHRVQVISAISMIGRANVQLGRVNEAIDVFLSMIIEFPETEQVPETSFFIGYCYMLQNKFELAKQALELVVADFPQSSYASKAKICLTRLRTMSGN